MLVVRGSHAVKRAPSRRDVSASVQITTSKGIVMARLRSTVRELEVALMRFCFEKLGAQPTASLCDDVSHASRSQAIGYEANRYSSCPAPAHTSMLQATVTVRLRVTSLLLLRL